MSHFFNVYAIIVVPTFSPFAYFHPAPPPPLPQSIPISLSMSMDHAEMFFG